MNRQQRTAAGSRVLPEGGPGAGPTAAEFPETVQPKPPFRFALREKPHAH
jgi:hypothetical protein